MMNSLVTFILIFFSCTSFALSTKKLHTHEINLLTHSIYKMNREHRAPFALHHVRKKELRTESDKILYWIPSYGLPFESYLVTAKHEGPEQSQVGYLALKGMHVYGISHRERFVTQQCIDSKKEDDCRYMRSWGFDEYLDDIIAGAYWIKKRHPNKKIIIGGLSLGAFFTLAAINKKPKLFSGAIVWEGLLYSKNPELLELNRQAVKTYTKRLSKQAYDREQRTYSLLTKSVRKNFLYQRILYPVFFKPLTYKSRITPSFTMFTGSVLKGPKYAHFETLHTINDTLIPMVPLQLGVDFYGILAGHNSKHYENLSKYNGHVFAIKCGKGFGDEMDDTLDLLNSSKLEVLDYPNLAHQDLTVHWKRTGLMMDPLFSWLESF